MRIIVTLLYLTGYALLFSLGFLTAEYVSPYRLSACFPTKQWKPYFPTMPKLEKPR